MNSQFSIGRAAVELRELTRAEMEAVSGGFAINYSLWDGKTMTGTIVQENGVIRSYVNGKLVSNVHP